MKVHADAAFSPGTAHVVTGCEDHAVAGEARAGGHYAVLCDGCSTAPGAGVGAVVQARAAARILREGLAHDDDDETFFRHVALDAVRAGGALALPSASVMATLLTVEYVHVIRVRIRGDGVVVFGPCPEGSWEGSWQVSFFDSGDRPDYPAYSVLDDANRESCGAWEHPHSWHDGVWRDHEPRPATTRLLVPNYYPTVLVFSDGVNSFVDAAGKAVDGKLVLQRFLGNLRTGPSFLRRKLGHLERRVFPRLGWRHGDDLSVAGIQVTQGRTE